MRDTASGRTSGAELCTSQLQDVIYNELTLKAVSARRPCGIISGVMTVGERHATSFAAKTLVAGLLLMLAACSAPPAGPDSQPPAAVGEAITHTVRVLLDGSASPAELEEQYGGTVLVWHDEPGLGIEPFAVVAVGRQGTVSSASVAGIVPCATEPLEQSAPVCIEENRRSLLAGARRVQVTAGPSDGLSWIDHEGRSVIWNEGEWLADEGRSTIWNEGEFSWQPQNTPLWSRLQLELAHNPTLASNLGAGVTVAVIDTGVDLVHPQLSSSLAPAEQWLDLVGADTVPQEEGGFGSAPAYGHGTNVAGIIRQVAPAATILPIRVLDGDGRGYVADLIIAIEHALAQGADIINLSLGSSGRHEALSSVISRAAGSGVFVVMAAGNSGGEVVFPASESREPNLPGHALRLSVTSVDENDERSGFAAYGFPVGLAAPGEGVWGPAPELHTAAWTGTSMTAPMAAGALALALGEVDRLNVPPDRLVERLGESGADLYDGRNAEYRQWQQLGAGRLDFWRFLDDVLDE